MSIIVSHYDFFHEKKNEFTKKIMRGELRLYVSLASMESDCEDGFGNSLVITP